MKPEITLIARAVIQAVAGWIGLDAAKEGNNIEALVTAATFIATLIWSAVEKKRIKARVKEETETQIMKNAPMIFLVVSLFAAPLLVGCAGSKAQRATYTATQTAGVTADAAMQTFSDYMVEKAKAAIGPGATATSVSLWVQAHPDWKRASEIFTRYQLAYRGWVALNKAAGSGATVQDAAQTAQFRDAMQAASSEFVMFVTSISVKK